MAFIVEMYEDDQISSDMYEEAAQLFSSNYGLWGPLAESHMGLFAQKGRRVRMSAARLKSQCQSFSPIATNIYARIRFEDELVGNVFATRWMNEERSLCWVTQLCVHLDYRQRGFATQLVAKLRERSQDFAMGILSSHPAAIQTLLRACGSSLETYNDAFARSYARSIMHSCPAEYVRNAQLGGSAFGHIGGGSVSCADTGFFVDHGEPLAALDNIQARGMEWPFGSLPDGCEFLALVHPS